MWKHTYAIQYKYAIRNIWNSPESALSSIRVCQWNSKMWWLVRIRTWQLYWVLPSPWEPTTRMFCMCAIPEESERGRAGDRKRGCDERHLRHFQHTYTHTHIHSVWAYLLRSPLGGLGIGGSTDRRSGPLRATIITPRVAQILSTPGMKTRPIVSCTAMSSSV